MRNPLIKALLLAGGLGACDSSLSTTPNPDGAILTVVFQSHPADTMLVFVQSQSTIDAAKEFVRTQTGPRLISGKIVRGPSSTDPRYPFHFVSDSVSVVGVAIELCDGAPMHTTAEVDAFFTGSTGRPDAQSATWCPWSSYPIAVEDVGLQ
jgi:hypothetical protein